MLLGGKRATAVRYGASVAGFSTVLLVLFAQQSGLVNLRACRADGLKHMASRRSDYGCARMPSRATPFSWNRLGTFLPYRRAVESGNKLGLGPSREATEPAIYTDVTNKSTTSRR
jgi:hypothetical protein